MKLLPRYIASQVARPMIFIILAVLLALLAERTLRVVDIVIGLHGSLLIVFEMLGYLVPHYIGLALPAALFVAILVAISRMSRDGELDAAMAAGIGFAQVLRPLMVLALLMAALNLVVQSHLQPWSRYAYRAALATEANVPLQLMLRPGRFVTLGDTTYSVDEIEPGEYSFRGLFLVTNGEDGSQIVVTAESGRILPATDSLPATLELENGVQQYVPAADPVDGRRRPPTTLRFRHFVSDLTGQQPGALPERGENEREMTVPELWVSPGVPEKRIEPAEVAAELHVRLVRVAATFILPLVAAPLAIGRRRAHRSYGFVIGITVLLLFNQLVQLGKSLADDGKISVLLGLWLPFGLFTLLGIVMSGWRIVRVPSGSGTGAFERMLERLIARIGRLLPSLGEGR